MPAVLQRPHPLASEAARQITSAANPRAPTATVLSPSTRPVAVSIAAIVCELLSVSAPSTIMTLSTSFSRCRSWTPGGQGLLGALPRSDQITPNIPDRRRATQQKEVRPNRPTASKRVSSPPGRDLLLGVRRHRPPESKQQVSK